MDTPSSVSLVHVEKPFFLLGAERESACSTYSRGAALSLSLSLSSVLTRNLPPLHIAEGHSPLCVKKTFPPLSMEGASSTCSKGTLALLDVEKTLPPLSREGVCLLYI